MTEPTIHVSSVVDPDSREVRVEKVAPRSYRVLSPKELSATEALLHVVEADPRGERRKGE